MKKMNRARVVELAHLTKCWLFQDEDLSLIPEPI